MLNFKKVKTGDSVLSFNVFLRRLLRGRGFWEAVPNLMKNALILDIRYTILFALCVIAGIIGLPVVVLSNWWRTPTGLVFIVIIVVLNLWVLLRPVSQAWCWYYRDPLVLYKKTKYHHHRHVKLWKELFMLSGLAPVVTDYPNGVIIHDEEGSHLSVRIEYGETFELLLFGKHAPNEALGARTTKVEWFMEMSLKQFFEKLPALPETHRFMAYHYGHSKFGPLLCGARMGVPPTTLAVFLDNGIPETNWDDFKDYPAEWVLSSI